MDISTTWAASNPAVARLLWVLGLVLATLLVWFLSFCCYSWNHSSSPSLERYLAGRWALDPHPFTLCGCVEACDRFTTDMAAYCDSSSSSQARFYYSLSGNAFFPPQSPVIVNCQCFLSKTGGSTFSRNCQLVLALALFLWLEQFLLPLLCAVTHVRGYNGSFIVKSTIFVKKKKEFIHHRCNFPFFQARKTTF